MLNGDGHENTPPKMSRSKSHNTIMALSRSKAKKENFARAAHFLYKFLCLALHSRHYNVKLPETS